MQNVGAIRLANIEALVRRYRTRTEFCRVADVSPSQLSQLSMEPENPSFRRPGERFCRKLEVTLGLPPNSLDHPLDALGSEPERKPAFDPRGLTALQIATVEQITKAMRMNVVDDGLCVDLLGKFTSLMRSDA